MAQLVFNTPNNPGEKIAVRPLRPTLFIGLGGTGLKVLARVRRRLYERSAEPLPIYAFLGVDTDEATLQKGGTSSTKGMRLAMDDLLHIGLNTAEVTGILDNLATTYGHYKKWLPVQKIKDLSKANFTTGASQTRPLGRLLFLQGAHKLAQMITERVDRVTSKDALSRAASLGARTNTSAPAKVDVVVVASIGGGTGSGGLLDCAYIVQAIVGDKLDETRGVILLPDVFEPLRNQRVIGDDQLARIRANGYGALRELEYFGGLKRRDFPTDGWPGGLLAGNRKLNDPPFKFTYLFSRKNSRGHIEEPELVYDHVADALALPLSDTTLAGTLRGSWNNAAATLAETTASSVAYADSPRQGGHDPAYRDPQRKHVLYKRPFNCSYSSMGIASVTLRVSELWRLASARLLALAAEWELGTASAGRAAERSEAAMKELASQPSVSTKNHQAVIEQACGDRNLSSTEVIAKCREQVTDLRSRFEALRDSKGMPQGAQPPQAVPLYASMRERADRVVKGWDAGQRKRPHRERVEFFRSLEEQLTRGLETLDRTDRPVGSLAGQSQWEDLDLPSTGGKRLIDLHGRAEALLRQKVKQSALQQLDDQRHVLETALRALLLAEIRKQASKAREAATEDCRRVEACIRALEGAQDDLRKAFDDDHNWVLTKNWADRSSTALDAQISQALAEPTGRQAEAELGDAAFKRVLETSLQQAAREVMSDRVHPTLAEYMSHEDVYGNALAGLLAIVEREFIKENLPGKKQRDVFAWLEAASDLDQGLNRVSRSAEAYWPMNSQATMATAIQMVKPFKLAGGVEPQPASVKYRNIRERLKQAGWTWESADTGQAGAPWADVTLVSEAHGLPLVTLDGLSTLHEAYRAQEASNDIQGRHLDQRLISKLPMLDFEITDESTSAAWQTDDEVLLSILLRALRWDDSEGRYVYRDTSDYPHPVGPDHIAAAQWLLSSTGKMHERNLRDSVKHWLDDRSVGIPEQDSAPDTKAAAERIADLWLALEVLRTHVFPEQGDESSAGHTRILRLQRVRVQGAWDRLAAKAPGIGTLRDLYTTRAAGIQGRLAFVGPAWPPEPPDGKQVRLVSMLPVAEHGDAKAASMLNAAYELGWFPEARIAEQVKTLLPRLASAGAARQAHDGMA